VNVCRYKVNYDKQINAINEHIRKFNSILAETTDLLELTVSADFPDINASCVHFIARDPG
jgi:hypothetical protein